MKNSLLRMLPMILVMGSIFFLSHTPGDELSLPEIPGIDKLAHLTVYGMLGISALFWLVPRGAAGRTPGVVRRSCLLCILICGGYGLSDEFHQSFIPGRSVSGGDLLADICGGLLACVLYWWFVVRRQTV